MMIHNNYPSIDYNKWLKRLNDTQLNEQTNKNSSKVPKVVKLTNKKTLLQKQKAQWPLPPCQAAQTALAIKTIKTLTH